MNEIIVLAKLNGEVVRRVETSYGALEGWVRAFLAQGYTVEIKEY